MKRWDETIPRDSNIYPIIYLPGRLSTNIHRVAHQNFHIYNSSKISYRPSVGGSWTHYTYIVYPEFVQRGTDRIYHVSMMREDEELSRELFHQLSQVFTVRILKPCVEDVGTLKLRNPWGRHVSSVDLTDNHSLVNRDFN